MEYAYDAFISYRHSPKDEGFARDVLRQAESWGLRVAIDERDFVLGADFLNEMERCVRQSRVTVAVISELYLKSGNCAEEAIIGKVLDMAERTRRIIPLITEKVEMPTWLYSIVGIDFVRADPLVDPWERLRNRLMEGTAGVGLRPAHTRLLVQSERLGRQRRRDEEEKRVLNSESGVSLAEAAVRRLGEELRRAATEASESMGCDTVYVDIQNRQAIVSMGAYRVVFQWAFPWTNSLVGAPFDVITQHLDRVSYPSFAEIRSRTMVWAIDDSGQLGWVAGKAGSGQVSTPADMADQWIGQLLELASKPPTTLRRGRGGYV